VYEVRVQVVATTITEIQDEGDGILYVTTEAGESFEITEEAFTVLTGRDVTDVLDR
jgi:hypothetical protein